MRTIANTLIYILLSILIVSCDVLNQMPESDITSMNFWKTPKDAEAGLVAVYNLYRSTKFRSFELGEGRSDNLETPSKWRYEWVQPDPKEFNDNIVDANSGYCSWVAYYNVIARANEVIYYTDMISFPDEKDKKRILGEAYFLRADAYFTLVKNWGEVPLITKPYLSQGSDMYVGRTPVDEVYEQIVADLVIAEENLPIDRSDLRIRATKAAAQALFCDVLLTRGYTSFAAVDDFSNTVAKADNIIANKNYRMLEGNSYSDIFRKGNTDEAIFEVWSDYTQNATHNLCLFFLPRAYDRSRPYGGEGHMLPSHSIVNAFNEEPDDLRKTTTFTTLTDEEAIYYDLNNKGIIYGNKYLGTVTSMGIQRYSDDNIIVYRLPEVLLMKAEALINMNKVAEAMALVNEIRERAGLKKKTASSVPEALNILLSERRKEFAFEGKRWYDLVRTNKIKDFRKEPEFVQDRLLLAVPQSEIDKNELLLPNNPTY